MENQEYGCMCKTNFQGLILTIWAATCYTYLNLRSVMSVCRGKYFICIFKIQVVHMVVYSAFFP